jgi:cellobiose transport system substrate-binding protein
MDYGGGDIKAQWPEWKWRQGSAASGEVIGLGTDVGGMAMCYRTDEFAAAGLPTNRDEVSKLWPTWEDFIATGQKFEDAVKAGKVKNTHFMDGPAVMYRSILGQQPVGIYDGDKIVVETNPGVKLAWDPDHRRHEQGPLGEDRRLVERLERRLRQGHVRHAGLPVVDDGATSSRRPRTPRQVGHRGGARGRRQLGRLVPEPCRSRASTRRRRPTLAKWLTRRAGGQGLPLGRQTSRRRSPSTATGDQGLQNPFFSNAPVGEIFSKSVTSMVPQYMGPKSVTSTPRPSTA